MEVFYIFIDEFKDLYPKDFLLPFADIELKTEKRFYEYTIGRYTATKIAKEKFNIENPKIVKDENGKPFFKNSNLYFSISHSKNLITVIAEKTPCGIDVEFKKPKDLQKISNYYGKNFETLEDFYRFWTFNEASFKMNEKTKDIRFEKFGDYYLTVVSTKEIGKIEYKNLLLNKKTKEN